MKKLLNTLYVTTEGMALRKDGENVVAELDGAERGRVPMHMLTGIVACGPILLTPALIGACAGAGVSIVLLLLYAGDLVFTMVTHRSTFQGGKDDEDERTVYTA